MRTRSTTRPYGTLFGSPLFAACAATQPQPPPPLYAGPGESGREVTIDDALAQRYSDQALAPSWGFNHDEARVVVARFGEVSGEADVPIRASCFCRSVGG